MYDKTDLEIPFAPQHVAELASSTPEKPAGQLLNVEWYGFKMFQGSQVVNGVLVTSCIQAIKWDTISTGISGIAVGFFPHGNGFNLWPHVRIKASNAKILQGHNVFGSEDPTQGIYQMMADLSQAFPNIYAHIDREAAEVKYVDVTYSAYVREFFRRRIYTLFNAMASSNQKVNRNDDYLQLGQGSERSRAKIYYKFQELLADLKNAIRSRDKHRVAILSDKRLQDWTLDLTRFEATIGPRKFQALGIPTLLSEYVKFDRWFLAVHGRPLSQYLWELVFNPFFAQLEGHTMKNVNDDDIRLRIDAKFIVVKENGKICKRKAKAIFDTYCEIKREGYRFLCKSDSKTFFRNVKHLEEAGISRAFLKTLDPMLPNENVIPFVQIIKIDFSKQRPDWFVEPVCGYEDVRRHLKLVG
jgi:II/X family phage/plasmid replication protein